MKTIGFKHGTRRLALQAGCALAAAAIPPAVFSGTTIAHADTEHVYIVPALLTDGTLYAEPWLNVDPQLNGGNDFTHYGSLCNGDYGWGGWWHCDAGTDYTGAPLAGLDWHNSPTDDISGESVWLKGYESTPSVAAGGDVREYMGCSTGREILLHSSGGATFFEAGFVHLADDQLAGVGAAFTLVQGWNSFQVGKVRAPGECKTPTNPDGMPLHLHQDGSQSFRNRGPEDACNISGPGGHCSYPNPWSGSPPPNYLFDVVWQFNGGGGSGGK